LSLLLGKLCAFDLLKSVWLSRGPGAAQSSCVWLLPDHTLLGFENLLNIRPSCTTSIFGSDGLTVKC